MGRDCEQDLYAVLGISPSATAKEIKHAYHRLARRYHPDSREVETPTMLFHQVHEAYAVLSDPLSRRAYDHRREALEGDRESLLACNVHLSRETLYTGYEEQMLYALLEIEPARDGRRKLVPLDLSVVVDRSTSMAGARLDHVKDAVRRMVDELRDEDSLALVSFSDRAEVILSGQVGARRPQFKAALRRLRAEGGTELLQGLRLGLEELARGEQTKSASHLILFTDGRTYGDQDRCLAAAERAGDEGVEITAVGIGGEWNDELLDEIAARSGGTSAYAASPQQIQTLLRDRIQRLGSTLVPGLTLAVWPGDGVRVESAFLTSPALGRLDPSGGTMRLGSLSRDGRLCVLLEMAIRARPPGEHQLLDLELNGSASARQGRPETLRRHVHCSF
ncbi:MAG: VWA domain-containing protein, partial [Chloroflexota bacterium]